MCLCDLVQVCPRIDSAGMAVGKGDVDRVVADRGQPVDGNGVERRSGRSVNASARAPRASTGRAQAFGADLGRLAVAPSEFQTHVINLEHDRLRCCGRVERRVIAGEVIGQYRVPQSPAISARAPRQRQQLVAGSRKFRRSQDAIGPPRQACCKSRNLAVLGMRQLFSSVYLFEQPLLSSLRTATLVSRGALRRPPSRTLFSHPRGGGVERRQAHSFFLRVARARRDARACEARTCPGATGTPLGAPPWRFSAADPRWRFRQWDTGAAATARARPYCLAVGVRTSRGAVSRRSRGTPLLAPSAGRLRRRPLLSQDGNLVQ